MHYSVLIFHESDVESVVEKYCYDCEDEDVGADMQFIKEHSAAEIEAEYEKHIKENPDGKETYPDLESFLEGEYSGLTKSEYDEEWYGYISNVLGMYDWATLGGRWSGILPSDLSDKELKAKLKKALNLKDPKIKEKYRDSVDEYVKISSMPFREACAYLQLSGQSSISICKEISAQAILDNFKLIQEGWQNNLYKEGDDIISGMASNIIVSTDSEGDIVYENGHNDFNDKFFIETYNKFLKMNQEDEERSFQLTVYDFHS